MHLTCKSLTLEHIHAMPLGESPLSGLFPHYFLVHDPCHHRSYHRRDPSNVRYNQTDPALWPQGVLVIKPKLLEVQ